MKDLDQAVAAVARELALDPRAVARRKDFLELTAHDAALLRQVHGQLQHASDGFTAAFYDHLYRYPPLRRLLPDRAALERLKLTQSRYFAALTAGDYGPDYIYDRLRVGVVHQHIGLAPQWYIGAYRKYLADLMPLLWEVLRAEPARFLATYGALLKVVVFDIGLALDTYAAADRRAIVQHRHYAEQIVAGMPTGLIVLDGADRVRSINRAMLGLLGRSEAAAGTPLATLIPGAALQQALATVRASGRARHNVAVQVDAGRHGVREFEFNLSCTTLDGDSLLLLIARDSTERRLAQARLRESEQRFRLTFSQAAVGIGQLNADGTLQRANRKLRDILGYPERALRSLPLPAIVHPDDGALVQEMTRSLRGGTIRDAARELRCRHRQGHYVWINLTMSSMRDGAGEFKFIVVVEDISQRKQVERELLHLACHDVLTGLPNRKLLRDRLDQAVLDAGREQGALAVLFIDLDRFKNVNDSLGHGAGDSVLIEVAQRLRRSVRGADVVARHGGDEFVVLLTGLAHEDDAAGAARHILDTLAQPFMLQGQELFPACSIGVSLYPRDGGDSAALLKNADTAMYRAKESGRNQFLFYVGAMNALTLTCLRLESELRHALARAEFVLHYQPQVDVASGRVVGVEALLRWQPAGRAMVAPADFIGLAEETGLIVPIGTWVLRQACAQQRAWRAAGLPPVRMGVNLSARQFHQQDLAGVVARVLDECGCDGSWLTLEITESAIMARPEEAAETLRQLSAMGVQLAIDDFGTGYSSLGYLKRFPIHTLKIDRSFVQDLTRDPDDAAIVSAVIALAHNMKLSVVAEGVETQAQLAFLRTRGCDQMQGYLCSKPVPAAVMAGLLAQRRPLWPGEPHPRPGKAAGAVRDPPGACH
jgi:diguanylate cyclase (GGDEF)-like protein/PAS domain S-box-containing protein